jgi:myo-inositol catabolism protein IolH
MLRKTECDRVGYLYCCPHTFLIGADAGSMIRYAGKDLSHVHIADTHRMERIVQPSVVRSSPDLQARFKREIHEHLIPCLGDLDFKAIFQALRRVGYDGFLSAIPFSFSDTPVEAAIQTRKVLQRFLNG